MSIYTISLIVFFICVAFVLLGWFVPVASVVGAIAAFICAGFLIFGQANSAYGK